jgi:molecular chaperone DnaK
MAKIIGIDLGTTYSGISVWDEKREIPIIIPNLRGTNTTPSVVSLNEAGQVIVGEDAKQNLWAAPEDTISQIKREMGNDYWVKMRGKQYNPQEISAFILKYLKTCAEQYLGEPVHDAVITVPAYFQEVQRSATRDAGLIAGLNVHRLINEPTAAAIAYQVNAESDKVYAVYDFGGGTFDVSVIKITPDDVTVIGTGGDARLGGLDMDEAVMRWALREIQSKHGVDLSGDDAAKRRLKVAAEEIKKALVAADSATLNLPFLTVINNKPLSVKLDVSRPRFDMLIAPLLKRSLDWLDKAVASAEEKNGRGWESINGVLLVGGPTRLRRMREVLRERLRERCPGREVDLKCDLNPDEVVAMGAAIVAAGLVPIGRPPEEVEQMSAEQKKELQKKTQTETPTEAPKVDIYDVTGHSLGIAVDGTKFHKIIEKEEVIPITKTEDGFSNNTDLTTELLVQVYQGEEAFVQANTKIGEVRVTGLDPLPRGQQRLAVKFSLDVSGTLSTECTDLRTKKTYTGSFTFDGITRMSGEKIRERRQMVQQMMATTAPAAQASPTEMPPVTAPAAQASSAAMPATQTPLTAIPELSDDQIPADFSVFWKEGQACLKLVDASKRPTLVRAMTEFAHAVQAKEAKRIEDKAFLLQDALLEANS